MIGFGIRNLKIFFKDKTAVFFSLLAVFIIIGLYALFLGDVWTDSFPDLTGARYLVDSWIVAGILAVTSVTTTMGAFQIMVDDKIKKTNKDFAASPISNRSIVGGYIFSSIIIGILLSLITLVLAEIYIVANGGALLQLQALIQVLGLIVLATISNCALVLFVVSFFQSANAFATASTIIGTLIGFLTGIYLPIGNLPNGVQWIVKCFPVSHAAVLLRQVIMEKPISDSFQGAPTEVLADFKELMGVQIHFGDTILPSYVSILILIGTAIVFYGLSILNISRKKKK